MTAPSIRDLTGIAMSAAHIRGITYEDMQDIAQDTLERYLRQAPDRPSSWAYSVARNRALDLLRHRRVTDKYMPRLTPPPPADPAETALEALARSEIRAAVRRLPLRERQVTALRLADLDEAAIAAALGLSRGAVKSHAARARAKLRENLQYTHSPSRSSHLREEGDH